MTCLSCAERGQLLKVMRAAYARRDYAEVKRLLREILGTAKVDWEKLTTFTVRTRDGEERFDLNE
jgi:hypothetical protein